MKWTGSIKAKQVEIPEDLHAAVKAKAASMSIRTVDGYIDALDCSPTKGSPKIYEGT